jgi:cell division protein ZapA
MEKNKYTINVLGSTFTLQSEESLSHLREVAETFQQGIEEVQSAFPVASPLKVSILTALNLADELIKERKRNGRASSEIDPADAATIEEITQRMIAQIDESLEDGEQKLPQGS